MIEALLSEAESAFSAGGKGRAMFGCSQMNPQGSRGSVGPGLPLIWRRHHHRHLSLGEAKTARPAQRPAPLARRGGKPEAAPVANRAGRWPGRFPSRRLPSSLPTSPAPALAWSPSQILSSRPQTINLPPVHYRSPTHHHSATRHPHSMLCHHPSHVPPHRLCSTHLTWKTPLAQHVNLSPP